MARPIGEDPQAEERGNVRNLIRVVTGCVAWPSLTISLVMLIDIDEHLLHIAGLMPLGIAAVLLFFRADRLAWRFVPRDVAGGA